MPYGYERTATNDVAKEREMRKSNSKNNTNDARKEKRKDSRKILCELFMWMMQSKWMPLPHFQLKQTFIHKLLDCNQRYLLCIRAESKNSSIYFSVSKIFLRCVYLIKMFAVRTED